MVLLTMTSSLVEALQSLDEETRKTTQKSLGEGEPDLASPSVGNPISHGQILDISKALKSRGRSDYSLEDLLLGSRVYVPPPPPKREQTPEYEALMARLRREEENRTYERMINLPRLDTFAQRFPNAPSPSRLSTEQAFAEINRPRKEDEGPAEVSLKEINRQLTVVFNVLVSIFGVAVTVWFATRWRPATERVLLCLFAAILTAIADAVIYSGVLGNFLGEPISKKRGKSEVREVVNTWSVGGEQKEGDAVEIVDEAKDTDASAVRRRNKPSS